MGDRRLASGRRGGRSGWGQNAGNHEASLAAAAAEAVAAEWLLDLLDLPREASVGFVTGATVANFVCLAAARGAVLRRAGWDVEGNGLFGAPPIHLLIGDDVHTSVFSALQFLGPGLTAWSALRPTPRAGCCPRHSNPQWPAGMDR